MWSKCKLLNIKKWNDNLFTINFRANIYNFIPGQFTILKIKIENKFINRFYSYINNPKSKILKFYISKTGKISNILYNIDINNYDFYVSKKSYGNFILPKNKYNTLWMISSGTAIGPYISMLKYHNFKNSNFKNIKILHSIKYINNFVYFNYIKKITKNNNNIKLFVFVTKEKIYNFFNKRITYFLKKNNIKKYFGNDIDIYNDHIMICGQIEMINDILNIIRNKYKNINYKKLFTFEKYY